MAKQVVSVAHATLPNVPFAGPGGLMLETTDHAGSSDDAGRAGATTVPASNAIARTILAATRMLPPERTVQTVVTSFALAQALGRAGSRERFDGESGVGGRRLPIVRGSVGVEQ